MMKPKPPGMEGRPMDPFRQDPRVFAIRRVSHDRMAGLGKMDADLMGAAGKNFYFNPAKTFSK